jgi:hypothetical protein
VLLVELIIPNGIFAREKGDEGEIEIHDVAMVIG